MQTKRHVKLWTAVVLLNFAVAGIPPNGSIALGKMHEKQQQDIVETAISAGDFNTLVTALQKADLVETLQSEGPFTVFAPTDEAFDQLPDGMLEDLLKPENKERLRSILMYHVVPGEVMAADVVQLDTAETVNGKTLNIQTIGDTVMVDGARVTKTDIQCTNGVIHVINKVLIPR